MEQPLYFREVLLVVIDVNLRAFVQSVLVLFQKPQPGLLLLLKQQLSRLAQPQPVLKLKRLHVSEQLRNLRLVYLIFYDLHRFREVLARQGVCRVSDMTLDKFLDVAVCELQKLAVLVYLLEGKRVEHVALCYEHGVVHHFC